MPVVDLPLDQLRQYQGRNPKPADYEEYWKRAISDLASQPDEVELIPADFKCSIADCFHLWFTGVGGSRVHAKYLRPKRESQGPGALLFHGYSWHSGDWNDKLALVSEGFSVMALDCRGQGGLSQELGGYQGTTYYGHIIRGVDDPDPHKLLYRQMLLDTAQLGRIMASRPEVDGERMVAIGGSQGGALALACAALEPRIKKCAPMYPFLCDFKRVWEMDSGTGSYQSIRDWFRMFDPRHEREEWFFTKMGYVDIQNLVPRIQAEVLMACGLMDTLCPASSQFAAYNKIKSKKDIVIYPDHGHEGLPGFSDMTFEFVRNV